MPSASTSVFKSKPPSLLRFRLPSHRLPRRPVAARGIDVLDALLAGGLPIGAVTELIGPDCSGRTSIAASFLARMTRASKVCAWIDVSNTFDPLAAAAVGLDLDRLLWVRCGKPLCDDRWAARDGFQPFQISREPSISSGRLSPPFWAPCSSSKGPSRLLLSGCTVCRRRRNNSIVQPKRQRSACRTSAWRLFSFVWPSGLALSS
jgi:hypothetical protein